MQQFDLKVYNLIVLQIETKKSNTADKCGDSTKYFQSKFSHSINGMYIWSFCNIA